MTKKRMVLCLSGERAIAARISGQSVSSRPVATGGPRSARVDVFLGRADVHENLPQPRFETSLAAKVAERPDRPHEGFVDCISTALDVAQVRDREAKEARVVLAVDRLDVGDRAGISHFGCCGCVIHYLDAQPGRIV